MAVRVFEQAVVIQAPMETVEQCFTDLRLMHRWLNPLLRCEPVGEWSTAIGAQSRFTIQLPVVNQWWQPTLQNVVVERAAGLVVWEFSGFFQGRDRWQCIPQPDGTTQLVNRFEFAIANPLIAFGFNTFAAHFTQADMRAQLGRLKRVAEGEG